MNNPFVRIDRLVSYGDGRPYHVEISAELARGIKVCCEFEHPAAPNQLVSQTEAEIKGRAYQMLLNAMERVQSMSNPVPAKDMVDALIEDERGVRIDRIELTDDLRNAAAAGEYVVVRGRSLVFIR